MSTYAEKAARINEAVDVAMLAIVEDGTIALVVLLLCLWLFTRMTYRWRYNRSGVQKDESVVPVAIIGIGGFLLAGLIMAIYFDIKRAVFGGILSHTWFLG